MSSSLAEVSKPPLVRWAENTTTVGTALLTVGSVIGGIIYIATDDKTRRIAGWITIGCLAVLFIVAVVSALVLRRRGKTLTTALVEAKTSSEAALTAEKDKHEAELRAEKKKTAKAEEKLQLLISPFTHLTALDIRQVGGNGHYIVVGHARAAVNVHLRLVNTTPFAIKVKHADVSWEAKADAQDKLVAKHEFCKPVSVRIAPDGAEKINVGTQVDGNFMGILPGLGSILVKGKLFFECPDLGEGDHEVCFMDFAWVSLKQDRSLR